MILAKRTYPRPTRRRPPRSPNKESAPQLTKAGARGLRESVRKNSPKTSRYYHIPREPRMSAADVAFAAVIIAVVLACIWGLAAAHDIGFETGRGEGWADGYAAGIEAAADGPAL